MLTIDDIHELAEKDERFLAVLRHRCENDFLTFVQVMFPCVYGLSFLVDQHHVIIAKVLEAVFRLKIRRLIIDIPPGYSKTELVVILFSAWCLAKEPRSRFLHTSYSDDLALNNSSKVRDVINSEVYQLLWPTAIRTDSSAKKHWMIKDSGGSFIAAPMAGQITGRRAGVMGIETFSGALIIDDPMKPDDSDSKRNRSKGNRKFKTTVRNRVATENVPIIIIAQRIHKVDLPGFLLIGGSGEKWHHLNIPVNILTEGRQPVDYKKEWTHGIPIRYNARVGPLWEYKHNAEDLRLLRKSDALLYATQYMQDPVSEGLSVFHENWWQFYKEYVTDYEYIVLLDNTKAYLEYKEIFADTAMKTGEENDYSVFQCWGKLRGIKQIALLDQDRGKWEAPDLEDHFIEFIKKHQFKAGVVGQGLRTVNVEDKASGTGLIQSVNRNLELNQQITGIPRNKDKVSRAKSTAPSVKRGEVLLPENADYLDVYLDEHTEFNEHMTHENDDQIDPTMDAVHHMLLEEYSSYDGLV